MALVAGKVEHSKGRLLSADIRVIHLKSILAEGELSQNSVVKESFTTVLKAIFAADYADQRECRRYRHVVVPVFSRHWFEKPSCR